MNELNTTAELNTKVNAKYQFNLILKKIIPETNRLAKQNEYLFMKDRARAHTIKPTLKMLKHKKQLPIIGAPSLAIKQSRFEPSRFWDLGTLGAKFIPRPNITDLDSLKEATVEEWNKIFHQVINKYIDVSRPSIRRIIEVEGRHIE